MTSVVVNAYTGIDGYWAGGTFSTISVRVGHFINDYNCFFEWSLQRLPTGITITSAYISVYVTTAAPNITSTIYFNDASSAVAPIDEDDANAKVLTTASVNWSIPNAEGRANSPDITAIIQELVDSYDYSSSNRYMMALIHGTNATSNYTTLGDYNDAEAYQAYLHIEYELPDGVADNQITWGADDGYWVIDANTFDNSWPYNKVGYDAGGNDHYHTFLRWSNIVIPVGAVIETAYIRVYAWMASTTDNQAEIYFNDVADPTAPTTYTNAESKVLTTEHVTWISPTGNGWNTTSDISNIVQELVNSHNYSTGSHMMAIFRGTSGDTDDGYVALYGPGFGRGAVLHIEFTLPELSGRRSVFSKF